MTRVKDKESFIVKARLIHGDKYSYDKFEYVNAKNKSTINCKIHGEFEQSADKHFSAKTPCPKCYAIRKSEIRVGKKLESNSNLTRKEDYEKMLIDKYGDEYSYNLDGFVGLTVGTVTLYCDKHDESTYVPRSLLISEYGCKHCGNESRKESMTKEYKDFLVKAREVHGDKYIYSEDNEENYKNRKSTIKITCIQHGAFEKTAQKHLSGQGCFECRIKELVDNNILTGGYSEGVFAKNEELKNADGVLYYLKIDGGSFYKIGITRNLKNRVKSIRSISKMKVEVLDILESNLYEVYKIEQIILNYYHDNRTHLEWSTELFDTNVLKNISLKDISQKHTLIKDAHETA